MERNNGFQIRKKLLRHSTSQPILHGRDELLGQDHQEVAVHSLGTHDLLQQIIPLLLPAEISFDKHLPSQPPNTQKELTCCSLEEQI